MGKFRFKSVFSIAAPIIFIVGCSSQSGTTSLSAEEAADTAIKFREVAFVPPPRTTADLRKWILMPEDGVDLPSCKTKVDTPDPDQLIRNVRSKICRNGMGMRNFCVLNLITTNADLQLDIGNVDISNRIAAEAKSIRGTGYSDFASALEYHAAFIAAESGNLDLAEDHLPFLDKAPGWGGGRDDLLFFKLAAQNSIEVLKGGTLDTVSEAQLINSVLDGSDNSRTRFTKLRVSAKLIRQMVAQNRLHEAEFLARNLLYSSIRKKKKPTRSPVGRIRGQAFALMAEVLLSQGRVEEALDFAKLSRYALVQDGVSCLSRSFNNALVALGDSFAANGRWEEASEIYKNIDANFSKSSQRAEFGSLTSQLWMAWTFAQSGDLLRADSMISLVQKNASDDLGATATAGAIKALITIDLEKNSESIIALRTHVLNMLPHLQHGQSQFIRLKKDILTRYAQLIRTDDNKNLAGLSAEDVASDLFLLSDIYQSETVQRAINEASIRSLADRNDPLVKQVQDLSYQIESVTQARMAAKGLGQNNRALELSVTLNKLQPALSRLQEEINNKYPQLAAKGNTQTMSVDDVRQSLKPSQALLTYLVQDDNVFAWAISKQGGLQFVDIPISRDELRELVISIRQSASPDNINWQSADASSRALKSKDAESQAASGGSITKISEIAPFALASSYELYQRLIEPFGSTIGDASEIVLDASDVLGLLPFELLTTEPHQLRKQPGALAFSEYRDVPWLLNLYSITVIPSVETLRVIASRPERQFDDRQDFVGFGDAYFNLEQANAASGQDKITLAQVRGDQLNFRSTPNLDGFDSALLGMLPRLADTRDELLSVANSLSVDSRQNIFVGKAASEKRVKALDLTDYRFVSFATHGLKAGELNGLNEPALALSSPEVTGDDGDDGLLTMGEIMRLEMDADLAVLSACNTASSDGRGAEMVSGLGRAFFYAGARSVLASHWPVHSAATTDQMKSFFAIIKDKQAGGRSEALQQAKLQQIDGGAFEVDGNLLFSYAHPMFWAPFSLIGDGG